VLLLSSLGDQAHLPSTKEKADLKKICTKQEALSSNLSTAKKQRKKENIYYQVSHLEVIGDLCCEIKGSSLLFWVARCQ
jgi:hypothetical protein